MVFERDNYKCVKCGEEKPLHCHHIDPVKGNPIESADIDNCITLCKKCHKKAAQKRDQVYSHKHTIP
jgi:5-methylcytosine-specific restriction endonuclease McrA